MRWTLAAFLGLIILAFVSVEKMKPGESGWTGKLLVVPMDGSHWIDVKLVIEEMGRRGHEVVVVIPEVSSRLGPGKHYTTRTFPVPYKREQLEKLQSETAKIENKLMTWMERISSRISLMNKLMSLQRATSESLLFNQELVDHLREQNFDAVLTTPTIPTGAILAYNLSVPAVYLLRGIPCRLDSKVTACPDPPSYVPRFFTSYLDRMSFLQRVLNFLVSILEPLMCKLMYFKTNDVASRFMQRDVSVKEIFSSGALWLLRYDFSLDFPKPLMPNMVLIGGVSCAIKSTLTKVSAGGGRSIK